ncbi:MAG: methyl-accepting chemotaxis protein, partial [Deltaproteobacteria bacterium]|nr:methyl-accepting chemotaxis protein [Deltaproteobacteria bacterium]
MKLQTKISIYLCTGLLVVGMGVAAWVGMRASNDMVVQANRQMAGQVAQMALIFDSFRLQIDQTAANRMNRLLEHLGGEWRLAGEEQVGSGSKNFPALKLNGRVVNNDFTLLDKFTQQFGTLATVNLRVGDDFYRIATSLKNEDGSRPVGTALGSDHPAVPYLLKGESYVGKVTMFNREFITKYQPIKNERGEVIGALFVGNDFTDTWRSLKASISSIRVGEAGYFYAVDVGNGKTRGNFLIHPSAEGKNAFELKDVRSGEQFIQKAAERSEGIVEYTWEDPKFGQVTQFSVFKTYAPWQIQFHISAYADEYLAPGKAVGLQIAVAMLAAAVLMAILAIVLVNRLVLRPLGGEPGDAADLAARIANGDLTHGINAPAGSLLGSLGVMQQKLREVFAEVINSAGDIAGRSESVATSSREIGQAAHSQAESTSASAANIEELTVSIS